MKRQIYETPTLYDTFIARSDLTRHRIYTCQVCVKCCVVVVIPLVLDVDHTPRVYAQSFSG